MTDTTELVEYPTDLRALIRQRTETKLRRIHRQWFCFEPAVQADLEAAEQRLAELVGVEVLKQQAKTQPSRKYALPSPIVEIERQVVELRARSRQVGAMGVFQNLTDDQVEAAKKATGTFEKAQLILTEAFVRWEDADGHEYPADVLGRDDLDTLMQPEVLEQGEWMPLASKIIRESTSPIERPTLPAP